MKIAPRQLNLPMSEIEQASEWARCAASPLYFIVAYGWVMNATEEAWLPFALWPAQRWLLVQVLKHKLLILLKARQLGMTWLLLGHVLWLLIFRPVSVIGIFSRTEEDAMDLLDTRLKGMYARLPAFLRCARVVGSNRSHWQLSNGSMAMAFATTGGRQYTFSFVLVDEAEYQPQLAELIKALKPTVDAGGVMVMLSSVNKRTPRSQFKQIYRAAKAKANAWRAVFLPWWARPGRTAAWHAAQERDVMANTGALDDLHQEYPATDGEALAPLSLDKRIAGAWLLLCYVEQAGLDLATVPGAPNIAQLVVFVLPQSGRSYVLGVDPAEGNPTSDDSAICVLDVETGEECAALAGKFQPALVAAYADQMSSWYNGAGMMVARNNHGHAVLTWLNDNVKKRQRILKGRDKRDGVVESTLGKVLIYDALTQAVKDKNLLIHSFDTYLQVAGIEGATLRGMVGEHDDRADALAVANWARTSAAQVSTGGY